MLFGLVLAGAVCAQNDGFAKLPPAQAASLSTICLDRAKWFLEMPQFNRDSSIYYSDKALLENKPVRFDLLSKIYLQKIIPRLYPFATLDSLAEIGWRYFEQIPAAEKDRLQEFNFLVSWAGIKLERALPKDALALFH